LWFFTGAELKAPENELWLEAKRFTDLFTLNKLGALHCCQLGGLITGGNKVLSLLLGTTGPL